jgi:hypothetical protein
MSIDKPYIARIETLADAFTSSSVSQSKPRFRSRELRFSLEDVQLAAAELLWSGSWSASASARVETACSSTRGWPTARRFHEPGLIERLGDRVQHHGPVPVDRRESPNERVDEDGSGPHRRQGRGEGNRSTEGPIDEPLPRPADVRDHILRSESTRRLIAMTTPSHAFAKRPTGRSTKGALSAPISLSASQPRRASLPTIS